MSRLRLIIGMAAVLMSLLPQDISAQCTDCPTQPADIYLVADNLCPVPGDQVCYRVVADGFQNVVTLQFTVTFTTNTLSFASDQRNLAGIPLFGDAFQEPMPGTNFYSVLWFDNNAVPRCRPDGTELMEICFDVIGNPGEDIRVEIGPFRNSPAEIGYFDVNSVACPGVSTELVPAIDKFIVPTTICSDCSAGLQIFSNAICGTPTALREGKVRLDIFCGTPPYSLSIDGTRTIDNITDDFIEVDMLALGSRIFRLTDANGDTDLLQVEVGQAESIDIIPLVVDDPDCFAATNPNGRIELSITGGTPYAGGAYDFDWGGSDFGRSVDPELIRIGPGEYPVTIRDSLGCAAVDTFRLTASEVITSVSVGPSTCNGVATGQIVAVGSGGMPHPGNSYTYYLEGIDENGNQVNMSQRTPVTAWTFDQLPAGDYVVYSIDNNPVGLCDIVLSDTITIPNLFNFSVIKNPNPAAGCAPGTESAILNIVNGSDLLAPIDFTIYDSTGMLVDGQMNLTSTDLETICLPQGDYRIEIQDQATCMVVDSFTLDGCDLSINPIPTGLICPGESDASINLFATSSAANISFLWDNGATTENITNLGAGDYTVTITDSDMCQVIETFTIALPLPAFTLDLAAPPIACPDGTTSITATPSGGLDPYDYEWSPDPNGTFDAVLGGVGPGTYYVTVLDAYSGCLVDSIVINPGPIAPGFSLTPAVRPDCEGDASGAINISIQSNSDFPNTTVYDFEASSGEMGSSDLTFSPANLLAGEQWIVYSIPGGCVFDTVRFTVPEGRPLELDSAQTTFGNVQCFGDPTFVTLVAKGTANVNFEWPGTIGTGATASVTAGTYSVTLTSGSGPNVCMSIVDIVVTEPDSFGISANIDSDILCEGDLANLAASNFGGTNPISYEWIEDATGSVVSTDPTANGLGAGTYILNATDDNGCVSSDMVTLTVNDPVEGFLAPLIQPFCFGDPGMVFIDSVRGGRPPYRYQVDTNPAVADTVVSSVPSGDHRITIFDRNGCEWSQMFTIDTPEEVAISLSSDAASNSVERGGDATLTAEVISPAAIDTILWTSSDGAPITCLTNDCSMIGITPVDDVTYEATVIDVDGCTATATIDINVIRSQFVYAPNIFMPDGGARNARNEIFQINAGAGVEAIDYIRIYDRWGNLVHEENSPAIMPGGGAGQWDGTIRGGAGGEGQALASGVYVYVFQVRYIGDPAPEIRKGDVTLIR